MMNVKRKMDEKSGKRRRATKMLVIQA